MWVGSAESSAKKGEKGKSNDFKCLSTPPNTTSTNHGRTRKSQHNKTQTPRTEVGVVDAQLSDTVGVKGANHRAALDVVDHVVKDGHHRLAGAHVAEQVGGNGGDHRARHIVAGKHGRLLGHAHETTVVRRRLVI